MRLKKILCRTKKGAGLHCVKIIEVHNMGMRTRVGIHSETDNIDVRQTVFTVHGLTFIFL